MKSNSVYFVVILSVTALTIACYESLTSTSSAAATAAPSARTTFTKKIDVGGYKLQIRCSGKGTPAVIVESSMGDPAVESGSWNAVISRIEQTAQICVYDRAGVGMSDRAPEKDQSGRTGKDMVKDLHTLLLNANVPAPYILVGHSIGGYNVRLFAAQYPDEVVGMVLADSSHPDQWLKIAAALPPEKQNESFSLKAIRSITDPSTNPERMDLVASAAQVRTTGSMQDIPLVVLSHKPGWIGYPNLPPDVSTKIDRIWQDLQNDLAGLSSNSSHIIATRAGHNIQVDEPQLVTGAILKVIAMVKK